MRLRLSDYPKFLTLVPAFIPHEDCLCTAREALYGIVNQTIKHIYKNSGNTGVNIWLSGYDAPPYDGTPIEFF